MVEEEKPHVTIDETGAAHIHRRTGRRATNKEIQERVMKAYHWILDGYTRAEVVALLTKNFPVKFRQAYRYYDQAEELIKNTTVVDRELAIKEALLARRAIRAGLKSEDISTRMAILKDEARLLGLYDQPEGGPSDGGLSALLNSDELIIIKH